ncbi:hypothetical protein DPMN_191594 [Dreissena polymorpha]|uniref:CUB domain-containing protein n=1 Tax=Dreissena polymorpha TaxID=45954 RepID=A0A9D4BEY7_DREPO|nr:hypothetical protein DPMN_191594 [Dreissena polymorpha]
MDYEIRTQCSYGYLELFNILNASSPSFGKYCGITPPLGFKSLSNSVGIVFFTDAAVSHRNTGFRMAYTFIEGKTHRKNAPFCESVTKTNYTCST